MTRALAIAVALLWGGEAVGQATRPCGPSAMMAKQSTKKYKEAPVAFGLQSNGSLLQVYASDHRNDKDATNDGEADTWTIVSTTPNGMSCIVAAGRYWQAIKPKGVPQV